VTRARYVVHPPRRRFETCGRESVSYVDAPVTVGGMKVNSAQGASSAVSAINDLSASDLAAMLRKGDLSAREVVAAHIQRAEEVHPRINALVVERFEAALAEASAADQLAAGSAVLPPLHGLPITIKKQFDVQGLPTTVGVMARRSDRAKADGMLVSRLRHAGAIVPGKTNVAQMLTFYEADNPLYGRSNNPWDLARTPGGSSGGEAAIVAVRASAFGLEATISAEACGCPHISAEYTRSSRQVADSQRWTLRPMCIRVAWRQLSRSPARWLAASMT
jgi:Amidase